MTLRSLFVKLGFKTNLAGLEKFEKSIDRTKGSMITLAAAVGAGTGILGTFIKKAADLEEMRVSFEVLTGSASQSRKTIDELFAFARKTPFEMPNVVDAAISLMGMTVKAEDLTDTLQLVGDMAAGTKKPIMQVAQIFGRVKSAGFLFGQELQNMRKTGMPIMQELGRMLNKSNEELMHMVRKRQISFETFKQAMRNLTSEGGRYYQATYKQSLAAKGIFRNIKDFLWESISKGGEKLLPVLKKIQGETLNVLLASQKLVDTKLGIFFEKVSKIIYLLHRSSLYLFSDIHSITNSLGGLNRVVQVLSYLITMYLGSKALMLLGKIGSSSIHFLSLGNIKLMLIGASLLLLLLVIMDIFGFIDGKKSVTGLLLKQLKEQFPEAINQITSAVITLKQELQGIVMYWLGLFTGNKKMQAMGLYHIEKAFDEMQGEGVRRAKLPEREGMLPGWAQKPLRYTNLPLMIPDFFNKETEPGKTSLEAPWYERLFNTFNSIPGMNFMGSMFNADKGFVNKMDTGKYPSYALIPNIVKSINDMKPSNITIQSPITVNVNAQNETNNEVLGKIIAEKVAEENGKVLRENMSAIESRQY
jgi:hypothetical protein